MNWKRRFALLAVPAAVLALGGGALAVQAAPVHQAIAVQAAGVQTATDPTEPAETTEAVETVEANEAVETVEANQ